MEFKQLFEESWRLFTAHLPALILSTLVLLLVSSISFGIMAPVLLAGYTQSLLLLVREGRPPEIRDLFGQMRLFFPLLALAVLAVLLVTLGLVMLVLPGIVVGLALSFFLPYVPPLMTDRKLGLIEAARESVRMALARPVTDQVGVVAIYLVINSVGNATGLGVLFTMPYTTLFLVLAYQIRLRAVSALPPRASA